MYMIYIYILYMTYMIYVQALFSAYRKKYRLSREYDQIKTTCRWVHLYTRPTEPLKSGLLVSEILLMEEILHHLGCIRPYRSWDHQIIIILGGFSGFQPSTVCFCIKNQASLGHQTESFCKSRVLDPNDFSDRSTFALSSHRNREPPVFQEYPDCVPSSKTNATYGTPSCIYSRNTFIFVYIYIHIYYTFYIDIQYTNDGCPPWFSSNYIVMFTGVYQDIQLYIRTSMIFGS